ncbi:MAG: hypothetical protein WCG01_02555 [bacterium]
MASIYNLLANLFYALTTAMGYVLVFLFDILVKIAQFSTFLQAPPVLTGWPIVRDICNMFFILVLLVIAFSTILQINNNWKKELPKLLMAAVLINFSKTIAGLCIDVSQIFMLTFVNAIAQNGAGNFAIIFGVDKTAMLPSTNDALTGLKTMAGAIAGFIASCITAVVTVFLLAALVSRIVKLWIYLILSPAPYLLNTFSQGKKYASTWWADFSKELICPPLLMFFVWLALTIGSMSDTQFGSMGLQGNLATDTTMTAVVNGGIALFTDGPFQRYLIVIGFLMAGLQISSQCGGSVGSAMGKATKKVTSGLNMAGKGAVGLGIGAAALGARNSLRLGGAVTQKIGDKTGFTPLSDVGRLANTWGNEMSEAKDKQRKESAKKFFKKIGFGEKTFDAAATAEKGARDFFVEGPKKALADTVRSVGDYAKSKKFDQTDTLISQKKAAAEAITKQALTQVAGADAARNAAIAAAAAPLEQLKNNLNNRINTIENNATMPDAVKKARRATLLQQYESDKALAEVPYNAAKAAADSNFESIKASINSNRDNDIKNSNTGYDGRLRNEATRNQADANIITKSLDAALDGVAGTAKFTGTQLDEHKPLGFIHEALQGEVKDKKKREKIQSNMDLPENERSHFTDTGAATWYSESGMNANQTAMFKDLANGSERSNRILSNMESTLKTLQARGWANLSGGEKATIVAMKQGIAANLNAKKIDMAPFEKLYEPLNNLSSGNSGEKEGKKIEEHQKTVV